MKHDAAENLRIGGSVSKTKKHELPLVPYRIVYLIAKFPCGSTVDVLCSCGRGASDYEPIRDQQSRKSHTARVDFEENHMGFSIDFFSYTK